MSHHDVVPVEDQVTCGGQAPQAISHIIFAGIEGSSKTVDVRTRSGGSETAIDREPHVLVVDDHPATLVSMDGRRWFRWVVGCLSIVTGNRATWRREPTVMSSVAQRAQCALVAGR